MKLLKQIERKKNQSVSGWFFSADTTKVCHHSKDILKSKFFNKYVKLQRTHPTWYLNRLGSGGAVQIMVKIVKIPQSAIHNQRKLRNIVGVDD